MFGLLLCFVLVAAALFVWHPITELLDEAYKGWEKWREDRKLHRAVGSRRQWTEDDPAFLLHVQRRAWERELEDLEDD